MDQSRASPRLDGYYIDHHHAFPTSYRLLERVCDRGVSDGKITPEPLHLAKTDRGNLIELYRFEIAEDKWKEFAARAEERFKNFGAAMIRRDQSNARSNCHGWVFAYGKFLLSGSDVAIILTENGYEKVTQPRLAMSSSIAAS